MSSNIKERIIESATDLFLKKGVKSVTMDEIATTNGVSKRTLYELFEDKSELIEACINYTDKQHLQFFEQMKNSKSNILEIFINIYKNRSEVVMGADKDFFGQIKRYYPDIYKRTVTSLKEKRVESSKKLLELGQEQGLFISNMDKDLVARVLSEVVMVLSSSELASAYKYNMMDLFKNTMILYTRGISTEKGRKIIDDFIEINN